MSMNLIAINNNAILIGQPLPFSLRDGQGALLANKGFVVRSKDELATLAANRFPLYIDISESESQHRAYVNKLHTLVNQDRQLGEIAVSQFMPVSLNDLRPEVVEKPIDWFELQIQANAILREPLSPHFRKRLAELEAQLRRQTNANPDSVLLALFHLTANGLKYYSATHAMLVSVICGLAARDVLHWTEEQNQIICMAALTMNVSMTDLQDLLAVQRDAPSSDQRQLIDEHAVRSVQLLEKVGVKDAAWLEAVYHHHTVAPGALDDKSEGQRLARVIQRADIFAALLATRATRMPSSPAAAMKSCYFDENQQVDQAGTAVIKAVGIYSPGSFVRLSTQEIGVVVRRGRNTTTPRVAVVINREGMPTVDPFVRDTSLPDYKVLASVPYRDVRVKLNLQRLLGLTSRPASDQTW